MARFAPIRSASRPKANANGMPTNWIISTARKTGPFGSPISSANVVPMRMIVLTPSL